MPRRFEYRGQSLTLAQLAKQAICRKWVENTFEDRSIRIVPIVIMNHGGSIMVRPSEFRKLVNLIDLTSGDVATHVAAGRMVLRGPA